MVRNHGIDTTGLLRDETQADHTLVNCKDTAHKTLCHVRRNVGRRLDEITGHRENVRHRIDEKPDDLSAYLGR